MESSPDVAIVGAGAAGAAMGIVLARRGLSVRLLEKSEAHVDRVRGESITPWGVEEARRLGLVDILIGAGGHLVPRLVVFGEDLDPAVALSRPIDLTTMFDGVGGALKLAHPKICQAFDDAAEAAGAELQRGVTRVEVEPGARPVVRYRLRGATREIRPRLVIGADGRGSAVARQIGVRVETDPLHHIFGGLLIDGADGWADDYYAIGNEGNGNYYIFPQGHGRYRLYYAYSAARRREFAGPDGAKNFLAAFRLASIPDSEIIANARPAGPCQGYPNADSWVDRPVAPGVVLIGDAAGHNDPTIGQGLSIALRDVRLVSEALAGNPAWTPEIFEPYVAERRERLRRLRVSAREFSRFRCEYTDEARERRRIALERIGRDPSLALPFQVPLRGPDELPDDVYTPAVWHRLYG
jgi:2-polyprenyl-6-methoxyphenol hydroxylase-like FAD-dependent oxidoreductase